MFFEGTSMVAVPFMQGRETLSDTLNGPTYKRAPFKVENNMGTPSTYVHPVYFPPANALRI